MNAPPDFAGYRVLARLGHGGMADVYLASSEKQPGFTKLFVLKALKEDFKNDPELLAMFVQEARIAARLNHANVVQTYEVGTANDLPFIAMEFLDGQALNSVVRRLGGKLPLDMYMRVLSDVLSGLHYAHELVDFDDTPMGIVHRDVSPHNVFITYDGVVKVLDFGIAKVASAPSITRTGVLKGKVSYMPREQVLNKNVDRRADIFAVGVMMFEVLSGQRMVKPGTPDVTVLQVRMAGQDPSIREAAANAPQELVAIAEKALRPEASERFATAEEMQLAIEEYLRGSSNPQPRDVGRLLRDAFGEERAKLKKIIEAQLAVPTPAIEIPLGPASGSLSPVPTTTPAAVSPKLNTAPDDELDGAQTTPLGQIRSVAPSSKNARIAIFAAMGLVIVTASVLVISRHYESGPPPAALSEAPSAVPVEPAAPSTSQAASITHVVLDVNPSSAIVTLDGNRVSAAEPLTHPTDASKHDLSFTAPGFRAQNESITFDHDQTVTVNLSPIGAATHPTAPIRSSPRSPSHPQAAVAAAPSAAPPAANTGFTEVHPRDPRPIDTTAPF